MKKEENNKERRRNIKFPFPLVYFTFPRERERDKVSHLKVLSLFSLAAVNASVSILLFLLTFSFSFCCEERKENKRGKTSKLRSTKSPETSIPLKSHGLIFHNAAAGNRRCGYGGEWIYGGSFSGRGFAEPSPSSDE